MKPIKLTAELKTPIWSGTKLGKLYPSRKYDSPVGETWETSADATITDSGICFGEFLKNANLKIPPLVKLIDAAAPLSVQVHPSVEDAETLGGVSKEEIWFILDAQKDAHILYGTKDEVSLEQLQDAIHSGDTVHLLRKIPVRAGDIYMIPCGMIHSLGGGVTVLEVQNTMGTTYRVQDISGNRETHRKESARSARIYSGKDAMKCAFTSDSRLNGSPLPGHLLASTEGFTVSALTSFDSDESYDILHDSVYVFCKNGSGNIGELVFSEGESLFIPTAGQNITLKPNSTVYFVI